MAEVTWREVAPRVHVRRHEELNLNCGLVLGEERALLIDTRRHGEVHQGTIAGSLNVPGIAKSANYGAWVLDPQREARPLVVLASSREEADEYRDHLVRVGIDTVQGFITSFDGLELTKPALVAPAELASFEHDLLLDVRNKTEYADGHIPGAKNLSGGRALWNLDELPREGTIVTYCQSGLRNSVTASALRREGFTVVELEGSYLGWQNAQVAA